MAREKFRRTVRHSVVSEVPDVSIESLYPIEDNYVANSNNTRSPKSLVNLCVDTLCRSLPHLDGELPPGLPQDVVDDIVQSLMRHAALNSTTLRALRNCELSSLSLAGCRGVSDEWLEPLSSRASMTSSPLTAQLEEECDAMELDQKEDMAFATCEEEAVEESSSSCSTSSFVSASSNPYEPHTPALPRVVKSVTPSTPTQSPEFPVDFMMSSPAPSTMLFPAITSSLTLLDLRGSQRLTDKGLMQLSDLGRLEVVKLDNCHSLVGRGLIAFASSHRLHTLSLVNCRRLTDEGIVNISHLVSLEALALDGCRCLTDRSLVAISNLYQLNKLDLSQCDLLTDDGLEHLEELEMLEELSFGWCRSITDHGLNIISRQPGRSSALRILRLARCPISDDGVAHIRLLSALEELDLNGCSSIGSVRLGKTLGHLPKLHTLDVSYCPGILRSSWQGKINALRSLELCYSGVKDVHLSRLVDLPALEELNLDSCPVGDWAIATLTDGNAIPNLKSLDLADTDLSDLGMVHLPKFKKLERLSLFYCNITNSGLRPLSTMTSLRVLNLDSREIGDDGLFHLRNLTNLRSLDIFSGRVTDVGCAHLSKIKSLESLELCGGGVSDLGCTLLASLENLSSLNLSQNEQIGNRGAAALAALSNLKALNLSNTRVDASALRFFQGLVKLQSIALYGCPGIQEGNGLDNLQSGLPSLKCIRLNSTSEDDGMIHSYPGDESDEEDAALYHPLAGVHGTGSDGSISLASTDESQHRHVADQEMDEDSFNSQHG